MHGVRWLVEWWNPPDGQPPPMNWANRVAGVLFVVGLPLMLVAVITGRNRSHPSQPYFWIGAACLLAAVVCGMASMFVGRDNQY